LRAAKACSCCLIKEIKWIVRAIQPSVSVVSFRHRLKKYMKFFDFFGKARYIRPNGACQFPYLRKAFSLAKPVKKATLYLSVLGFCEAYMNGKRITDELYITPYSQYNKQSRSDVDTYFYADEFFKDKLSYGIYVSEFDVTAFACQGKNAFGLIVSGGWYRSGLDKHNSFRNYGDTKACFRIVVEYADGSAEEILSDGSAKWKKSFLVKGGIFHEEQDETQEIADFSSAEFDDSEWGFVKETEAPEAEYRKNDCPPNRVIRYITPKFVGFSKYGKIYDVGENVTGYAVITTSKKKHDVIVCSYGEVLREDGELDVFHSYAQKCVFYTDGRTEHSMRFTWHGFRYFEISSFCGDDELDSAKVAVVHADIKNTSAFETDSEIVNWIYDAYVRTQAENYQCGVPTDCPQIERKGYTGDGQLLAESGMTLFDSKSLYKKWIRDIADCQDQKTGFVHYTAPCFIGCAGGPGGWSSAIVTVPYFYYQFYGEKEVLETYYPQMKKYLEFMRSETTANGLILMQKRKMRGLGDWASPCKKLLPTEFVNSCLFVDSLLKMSEIAAILGDAADWLSLAEEYKRAIEKAYFNPETGDYCNNEQASNAFALSIGLGDERTEKRLVERYRELKKFDTGIFGTKILVETLLRLGEADVVYGLWDSDDEGSFKAWKNAGATTLLESWKNARSHNHPMFGAFVKCFFESILGIRRIESGYKKVHIQPLRFEKISKATGKIKTASGEIVVKFERSETGTAFTVEIPDGMECIFAFEGENRKLHVGRNEIFVKAK